MSDPEWRQRYRHKLVTRQQALRRVHPGARIFVGSGGAEPQHLVEGLTAPDCPAADAEILHILTLGVAPYAEAAYSERFRHNAFFVGPNTRAAVADGRADYTPVYLSELPHLFRSRRIPLDVALVQVTPPDALGQVSLGVSVDVTKAAVEAAGLVIAEVNPRLPRTRGASRVPVEMLDALVEWDSPVIEAPPEVPGEEAERVGRNVARLVPDGATVQIGVGAIPQAVAHALRDHRDLGVHTELVSDWLLELVECGAVTNRRKSLHRGRTIASLCMGSGALYEYVDDNPAVELHPSEYTNDPAVIARNDRMVAINTALEIDLTGQICSDSLGARFYSGIGGQVDFALGAARSRGGAAIVALPSTARDGAVSRIVPQLSPGAGVVTPRAAAHLVVTEWGHADLYGRSVRERALALIQLAHPRFRPRLLEAAKRLRYVYPDQILPTGGGPYPERYETCREFAGQTLRIRPLKPTDEPLIKALFYSLSDTSVYHRYFHTLRTMPHPRLQQELAVDYRDRMAVVAVGRRGEGEEAVGLAQYVRDPDTNTADAAFLVRDDWQGRGLGGFLVRYLVRIARDQCVRALTALVMPDNRPMLKLFDRLGFTVQSRLEDGDYHLRLDIWEPVEGFPDPPPPRCGFGPAADSAPAEPAAPGETEGS